MAKPRTRTSNLRHRPHRATDQAATTSQWNALERLGPVIYAVRIPNGAIKIGFTTNLAMRLADYEDGTRVLGYEAGSLGSEGALHSLLREYRVQGREYYRPSPEVLKIVNDMRAKLGMKPLKLVPRS